MRIVAGVLTAVVVSGCGQAPPARPLAARVTEIAEVNTAGAYVDTIALSRDGSRVAIGQRNGSIRVWTPARGTEPATFRGSPRPLPTSPSHPPATCLPRSAAIARAPGDSGGPA